MSLLTNGMTAAVGLAAVAVLFVVFEQNPDATVEFVISNLDVIALAVQMVAAVALAMFGRRLAALVLTGTALVTLVRVMYG